MGSATIEISPAQEARTVTVTGEEVRRVLLAIEARGFSVCLNLDKELDELEKRDGSLRLPFNDIRDIVACHNGVLDVLGISV